MSKREWSKEFAYRLFDLMKYRCMSRRDLADALDINPATISAYLQIYTICNKDFTVVAGTTCKSFLLAGF